MLSFYPLCLFFFPFSSLEVKAWKSVFIFDIMDIITSSMHVRVCNMLY